MKHQTQLPEDKHHIIVIQIMVIAVGISEMGEEVLINMVTLTETMMMMMMMMGI